MVKEGIMNEFAEYIFELTGNEFSNKQRRILEMLSAAEDTRSRIVKTSLQEGQVDYSANLYCHFPLNSKNG